MDNLGHIVHYAIIPSVKQSIQFNRLTGDVLNSLGQIGNILLKFILHLFRPDRLMNISLQIHLLAIILLGVIELQIVHRLVRLIFLVNGVPHSHISAIQRSFLETRSICLHALALSRQDLHVINSRHDPVLVLIKHELIFLIVVVPSFWITWFFF